MTDSDRVEAVQRRGVAEHRSAMKPVMHRVGDGIMNVHGIHSAQQQIDSRANQWQPHHAVQIPTQENRRILRRRSESDVNETARTVLPRQRQVPLQMSSRVQPVSYRPSQIGKKRTSRNRQSNKMSIKTAPATLGTARTPHTPRMPTPFINPQELRARGTEESFGYADGKTEHSSSSPPSVMDRLKGWIKRQSPFRDERPIIDGRMGGTTCNDKSIYSHYFDSELDKLTPVPSSTLTRADLRKQTLSKSHDFPLIDHTDEVSCEMPDNKSQSHSKDHRRGRSSRKSTKSAVEDRRYLSDSDFRGGRYSELGRRKSSKRRHRRKQGSDLSGEESEFERNMAVTFLCLRLQSIKVDAERLKRLERTMLNNGQPSVSAREAMEWLLSHGDRIQENARKASEKLRAVFADISIPVECAVKVLEIFVRNGALFRKKDTEIKCTEFFGFRKTVSMDDITDILYYLAREQVHREFRGENLIT